MLYSECPTVGWPARLGPSTRSCAAAAVVDRPNAQLYALHGRQRMRRYETEPSTETHAVGSFRKLPAATDRKPRIGSDWRGAGGARAVLGEGLDGAVKQQVALRERDDLEERAAARDRAHACQGATACRVMQRATLDTFRRAPCDARDARDGRDAITVRARERERNDGPCRSAGKARQRGVGTQAGGRSTHVLTASTAYGVGVARQGLTHLRP